MKRNLVRYGLGWSVVSAALVAVLPRVIPGVNGIGPVLSAIAVAAAVDVAVFGLVIYGLVVAPRSFFRMWGLAVATKIATFSAALIVASQTLGADGPVFTWSLAAAFVAYVHNEVFVFARLSDRDLRPRAGVGN